MKAILACDQCGGIGYRGQLPWSKLDGDLARFKQLTTGCTIVMGRSTWDSLPKRPLPNRKNVVVSSQKLNLDSSVQVLNDLSNLNSIDDAWFIGGAGLLKHVYSLITEFHLTRAHQKYDCDVFIDLLYLTDNFQLESSDIFSDNTYEVWKRK